MEFYLVVNAPDNLCDAIKDKLAGMNTSAPFDRDYGMREFHIIFAKQNAHVCWAGFNAMQLVTYP